MEIVSSIMPLDKFGRHFHDSRRKIQYNLLKSKGQLNYVVPLNIPCVKSNSRYSFPLESGYITNAGIISKDYVELKVFINNIRMYSMDDLKNVRLKFGDILDFNRDSEDIIYVQLMLKCSMKAE